MKHLKRCSCILLLLACEANTISDGTNPPPRVDAGFDAGFQCPPPLATGTVDAGPIDPDAGNVMGGLGPPLEPETCWEANSDWRTDYHCEDPDWQQPACGEAVRVYRPAQERTHIYLPEPVDAYPDAPPTSGNHRPYWARWGEYIYLPPQRWLHNLEHGGVAFLYHPCVSEDVKEMLRSYAQSQPDDVTGKYRWIMTPYPDLPTAVAVVTWEHSLSTECFNREEVDWFLKLNYRHGPEDVSVDGRYVYGWKSR